jgi:hypothetical protein
VPKQANTPAGFQNIRNNTRREVHIREGILQAQLPYKQNSSFRDKQKPLCHKKDYDIIDSVRLIIIG